MSQRVRLHRALDVVLDWHAARRNQLHRALDAVLGGDEAEFKEADHPRQEDGKFGSKAVAVTAQGGKAGSAQQSTTAAQVRGHAIKLDNTVEILSKPERTALISKELGVNKHAATRYATAAALYSAGDSSTYEDVRSGKDAKTAAALESYIAAAPKWDGSGPTYRGLTLSTEELAALAPGSTLDMRGPSSWSSDESVAECFATSPEVYGYANGRAACLFQLPRMDKGTSIAHLSDMPLEAEVLASKDARYRVVGVSEKTIVRDGKRHKVNIVKVEEEAA